MEHEQVSHLLEAYAAGDREALDQLLPLIYDELRRIAHAQLRRERQDHSLSTTEVVHEAYLKLLDQRPVARGREVRFLAVAATAVRRALIEYARRRDTLKRGGGQPHVTLDENIARTVGTDRLLELDEALTRLASLDERLAAVIECRYFGGLTEEETAAVFGVTSRTVRRDWIKARAWLFRELDGSLA
jgi:RNA polymerase sigma factor (TIGR02999 family)